MKYNTFLISDLHFYHENVIRFDGRPYKTVEEMNQSLIDNWNSVVKPNDVVYNLGDMFMKCTPEQAEAILKQLNGRIRYIFGNHEAVFEMKPELLNYFESAKHYDKVQIVGKDGKMWNCILSHYPIASFEGQRRKNTIHVYGHVHNSEEQAITEFAKMATLFHGNNPKVTLSVNAGCMMPYMEYTPQTIDVLVNQAKHENEILHNLARLTNDSLQGHFDNIRNGGLQGQ